ncbi:LuxR C-terminal-related transcriptional regulator [Streptomyces sp. ODS28]|uniref:LuxR C-terminal-related transcriptional regulator n=1 Tax=Streptomyces sp. ODS28 TaxID=3136688 RepID=UPI0031E51784
MPAPWPYGETGDTREDAVLWRNRFLLVFDRVQSPLALCCLDGTILHANPAMAAEWGSTPGQLPGRNALELFRPRETGQLERLTEALRLGRRSRYPLAVRWHTGRTGPKTGPDPGSGTDSHPHAGQRQGELTVDPVSEAAYERPSLLLQLRVREPAESANTPRTPAASPVEARILALAAAGETTPAVAAAVGLTADGVNYHLTRLSRRWQLKGRTALVARAYALGVLDPAAWPPRPGPAGGATGDG